MSERFTNIFIGKLEDFEECQDSCDSPKQESEIMTQPDVSAIHCMYLYKLVDQFELQDLNSDEVPEDIEDDLKDTVTKTFFTCISTLKYKEKLLQKLVGVFHIWVWLSDRGQ